MMSFAIIKTWNNLHLILSIIITFIMLTFMGLIYYHEYHEQKNILTAQARMALNEQEKTTYQYLAKLRNDLLYINSHTLIEPDGDYHQDNLDNLLHFLTANAEYDQIRLIGMDGYEKLRFNQGNPPERVKSPSLQNKANRDYVLEGLKLEEGEIYFSALDLNQEHGKIELPEKPMLRLVTPYFTKDGKKAGLLVINYLAQHLLDHLARITANHSPAGTLDTPEATELVISNGNGEWILAPKPLKSFGFMYGQVGNEITQSFPGLWERYSIAHADLFSFHDNVIVFKTLYPLNMLSLYNPKSPSHKMRSLISQKSRIWNLNIIIPKQLVYHQTNHYFFTALPYLILFWIMLQIFAIYFVRIHRRNLNQSEELNLAMSAFENSHDGIIITDPEKVIVKVNSRYLAISGYSLNDVIGKTFPPRISMLNTSLQYETICDTVGSEGYWAGELTDQRKDGSAYTIWLRMIKVLNSLGECRNYLIIITDITEKKSSEAKMIELAYRDPLTHLPNRHLFYDRLHTAISKRSAQECAIAVLFIDLDNFKTVNDTAGHLIGDRFLIETSERIATVLRDEDTLARLGGDEFIILVEACEGPHVAAEIASRLLTSLKTPIYIEEYEFAVSASIGISLFPQDGEDQYALIKHADIAMYEAKKNGKDNFRFFTPSMNDTINRRYQIEIQLAQAIEKKELSLLYQPQFYLTNNSIIGAEALLRWNNSKLGEIIPAEFIPVAESSPKIIIAISEWVVRQVCKDLLRLHQFGHSELIISINISNVYLQLDSFVSDIHKIILSEGVPAKSIEFEIKEASLNNDALKTMKKLQELKSLGYHISIDSFGTGYLSLSCLRQFPLDKLKIDQSIIRSLPDGQYDISLIHSIMTICKDLDINVIAEGVENAELLPFLSKEKCHYVQGFHFSKPITFQDFSRLLEQLPK